MKGFTSVLMRETAQRRTIWWAALAAGLLPFLLAVLPGTTFSRAEIRDASALGIAAGFGLLVALVLGASVIGRDLSEGRISFDFTRPVGGLSIWSGRMAAAVVLALGSALVALLPATLAGGGPVKLMAVSLGRSSADGMVPVFGVFWSTVLYLLTLLFLVMLAHAGSVMVRSHSLWLLVDLVCCLGFLAVLFLTGRFLYAQGAIMGIVRAAWIALGILLLSLLAAGAAQVCKGRTDLKAGHKIISITLWSLCALGAVSIAGYANWYARVSPADLAAVYLGRTAPGGRWVYLGGWLKHRSDQFRPAFLYNPKTGKYLRLGVRGWGVAFSSDGSRCVWLEGWKKPDLYTADLTKRQPTAMPAGITLPERYNRLALSANGGRCAIASRSGVSLYDLSSGKLLASARFRDSGTPIPGAWGALVLARFANEDKLVIDSVSRDRENENEFSLFVRTLYVRRKKLLVTGRVEHLAGAVQIIPDSTGTRFVLATHESGEFHLSLRDGTSGALLAPLGPPGKLRSAAFLSDGRIAVAGSLDGTAHIWIFGAGGVPETSVAVPIKGSLLLGSEPAPGRLLVTGPVGGRDWYKHASLHEVNLAAGTTRQVAKNLRPLVWHWWFGEGTLPTGNAARLCLTADGSLVDVDPATGRETTLIKGY